MSIRKLLLFALVVTSPAARAQEAAKIKEVLTAISRVYDTMDHFRFDVQYSFTTDSANGKRTNDQLRGTYAIRDNNAAYKLDQMECVQNDSFFVAVYKQDKFIIITKPLGRSSARFFPLKNAIDSLVKLSADKYTIVTSGDNNASQKISFRAKDTMEKVSVFDIEYDGNTMLLQSLRYDYFDYERTDPTLETESATVKRKKQMLIELLHSRYEVSPPELFDEKKYIRFINGEYVPSGDYKGYKVYYSAAPVTGGSKN